MAVVNSLWSILTGEKICHGDERVKEIVMGTDEFIKNESLAGPLMIFPWLRHLPFIAAKFRASKSHPLKMRQLQVGKKIKGMCGPDENKRCRLDHDTWHDRSTVTHYVMQQLRTYTT